MAQARQEIDPAKQAALLAEARNWSEGGSYRIAMHTAVGGLVGGTSGALGAGASAAAAPLLNDLQTNLTQALKQAGANDSVATLAGQLIAQGTAAGIGVIASGGSAAGAALGLNVDANNRQLHLDEIQRIKKLANGDARKEARLTAAACALVKCYAEYPEGSGAYSQLKALADVGASEAYAGERNQLQKQTGVFSYSTTGLFSDQNSDAAKQINNTYQVTTRTLGAGQAVLGGLGVAASVATAPASCATGVGCFANAAVGTFSADAAYAGAKQMVSGQPGNTMLNQALQSLGMSPEAAGYAEAVLGVGAAAKAGAVIMQNGAKLSVVSGSTKYSAEEFLPVPGKTVQ